MLFQGTDDSLVRKVLGSVEGHMLQEMGEAILVVILEECPNILNDVKTCTFFWFLIVTDVISHPVWKLSNTDGRIRCHRLRFRSKRECHHRHQEQAQYRIEKISSSHFDLL